MLQDWSRAEQVKQTCLAGEGCLTAIMELFVFFTLHPKVGSPVGVELAQQPWFTRITWRELKEVGRTFRMCVGKADTMGGGREARAPQPGCEKSQWAREGPWARGL